MGKSSTVVIYGLCDPEGFLRYVGKTTNPTKRFQGHLQPRRRGRKCYRECWIQSLLAAGLRPEFFVIEECAPEDWKDAERFWISYFRFIGCDLVNGTVGGEGLENPTPEVRAKIGVGVGDAHRGRPKSEEHRAKLRENLRKATAVSQSAESRAKMSASRTGLRPGPETRAKMSAARIGVKRSRESVERGAALRAKEFILTSPDGEEMRIRNLSAFCREHNLNTGNLYKVLYGIIRRSQGWRIRRPDQE